MNQAEHLHPLKQSPLQNQGKSQLQIDELQLTNGFLSFICQSKNND